MQDEVLIKKLLDDDHDAYMYVIDTYSKLLWVIIGGILGKIGTIQDIEECIGDVYVELWKNPQAFNHQKGTLRTFLAVIAKRRALNVYRKLSKAMIYELDEAIMSSDDDLLDYIVDKETCQALYTAIKSLVEPNKEIVMRRYFLGEKPAYIAENIALPVKEVENRLYQSKLKLRKNLKRFGGYDLCPKKS